MAIKYNEKTGRFEGKVRSPFDGSILKIDAPVFGSEDELRALQAQVYTMCGGGLLGQFAAERPADFYIDVRVGRLPYPKHKIYRAVEVLRGMALSLGIDPRNLPKCQAVGAWVF